MIDVQKVNATKEKIIEVIRTAGPSFPTRISREAGVSPLFIGALLSEMIAERKVVMSAMKVGSSPLYLIPGQDAQLENFIHYLNPKERETIARLKEMKVVEDETEDPATRVALRKLKDFAIPINVRDAGVEKLYWKFFTAQDEEVRNILEGKTTKGQKEQPVKEEPEIETEQEAVQEEPIKEKAPKKKLDKKPSLFEGQVRDYLAKKEITIIEEGPAKAKEYNARIQITTLLGKQEYLLLAKEKKKITEDDLAIALHKAQLEKMPVVILTTGELDKAAKPYFDQWKNLLKIDKIKL